MSHKDCRCELLVNNEVGHVSTCRGCGHVQLTLQCLTVRFEEDAFRSLVDMVIQAQRRLDGNSAKKAVTTPLAPSDSLH